MEANTPRRPKLAIVAGRYYVGLAWQLPLVLILAVGTGLSFAWVSASGPFSWVPTAIGIASGAIAGAVLAPRVLPESNQTHAVFAVVAILETAQSVGGSLEAVDQLSKSQDPVRVVAGIELVRRELEQTRDRLIGSASEWDRLEPGITDRAKKELSNRQGLKNWMRDQND